MTLSGAKLICLEENGKHGQVVCAKGRQLSIGYYMNCDFVYNHPNAKAVHCEINCDAFGRVTIRNMSQEHPISVNGTAIMMKRPLLSGSQINVLDKQFFWTFPKGSGSNKFLEDHKIPSHEYEDLDVEPTTPEKLIDNKIPAAEQPPNSCPNLILHNRVPKRLTVHTFGYSIQSDEDGNFLDDSQDPVEGAENDQQNIELEQLVPAPNHNTSELQSASVSFDHTPKAKQLPSQLINIDHSPKTNIIDDTQNKEDKRSENKLHLLSFCNQSDIVITSFSPRETGVRVEKSFTAIMKPTVVTPRSGLHSTPKSFFSELNSGGYVDLMKFSTPVPSTKASLLQQASSSMYLLDLTTPTKLKPALKSTKLSTPISKSGSMKRNDTPTGSKLHVAKPSNFPIVVEEQSDVSRLCESDKNCTSIQARNLEDNSTNIGNNDVSIISLESSDSSVIEVSDYESTPGEPSSPIQTPRKVTSSLALSSTPVRTPQSLMKRVLLASAKKQAAITLGRDFTKTLSQNPTTPKRSTSAEALIDSRRSFSTPSKKRVGRLELDSSTSSSSIISQTSTGTSRQSIINRNRLSQSATKSGKRPTMSTTPIVKSVAAGNSETASPLSSVRKSFCRRSPPKPYALKTRRSVSVCASPSSGVASAFAQKYRKSMSVPRDSPKPEASILRMPSSILNDSHLSKNPNEQVKTVLFVHKQQDVSKTIMDNILGGNKNLNDETFSPIKVDMHSTHDKNATISQIKEDVALHARNVTFSPEKECITTNVKDTTPSQIKEDIVLHPKNVTFSPEKECITTNVKDTTPSKIKEDIVLHPKNVTFSPEKECIKTNVKDTTPSQIKEDIVLHPKNVTFSPEKECIKTNVKDTTPSQIKEDIVLHPKNVTFSPEKECITTNVKDTTPSQIKEDIVLHAKNVTFSPEKQDIAPQVIDATFSSIKDDITPAHDKNTKISPINEDIIIHESNITFTPEKQDVTHHSKDAKMSSPLKNDSPSCGNQDITSNRKEEIISDTKDPSSSGQIIARLNIPEVELQSESGATQTLNDNSNTSQFNTNATTIIETDIGLSGQSHHGDNPDSSPIQETEFSSMGEKSNNQTASDDIQDTAVSSTEENIKKSLTNHTQATAKEKTIDLTASPGNSPKETEINSDSEEIIDLAASLENDSLKETNGNSDKEENIDLKSSPGNASRKETEISSDKEENIDLAESPVNDSPKETKVNSGKEENIDLAASSGNDSPKETKINSDKKQNIDLTASRENCSVGNQDSPSVSENINSTAPFEDSPDEIRKTVVLKAIKNIDLTESPETSSPGTEVCLSASESINLTVPLEVGSPDQLQETVVLKANENIDLTASPENSPSVIETSIPVLNYEDHINLTASPEECSSGQETVISSLKQENQEITSSKKVSKNDKCGKTTNASKVITNISIDEAVIPEKSLNHNVQELNVTTESVLGETANPLVVKATISSPCTPRSSTRRLPTTPRLLPTLMEIPNEAGETKTPKYVTRKKIRQTPKSTDAKSANLINEENLDDNDTIKTQHKECTHLKNEEAAINSDETSMINCFDGMPELLETPKNCSTPRTKKLGASSIMHLEGIKNAEDGENSSEEVDESLGKFFKTPKAKNVMILSSPKSVHLKVPTDSVELLHSTEYDMNEGIEKIEDIFRTPGASRFEMRKDLNFDEENELTTDNTLQAENLDKDEGKILSAEEAFDKLLGNSTPRLEVTKNYIRKISPKQQQSIVSSITKISSAPCELPKTDIQEWVDSIETSDIVEDDEKEITFSTSSQAQHHNEVSRNPLEISHLVESKLSNRLQESCAKIFICDTSENCDVSSASFVNDPLAVSALKAVLKNAEKPNLSIVDKDLRPGTPANSVISGIHYLDQTCESSFSEALLVSDTSTEFENLENSLQTDNDSSKRTHTMKISPCKDEKTHENNEISAKLNGTAKLEMELAFENFEEDPKLSDGPRKIQTPEKVKTLHKSSRMTMGNKQVIDKYFDLNAEKEKLEMERAFENFEEEPTVSDGPRKIKTPEQVKTIHKSSRLTMGNKQVIDKSFDLNAEKEKLEMERAFENFEEEPTVSDGPRKIKTPEQVKTIHKSSRMTMGNKQVIDKSFDLNAEKEKLEMERAFENFEEEPTVSDGPRKIKTPEQVKTMHKSSRLTMGNKQVIDKSFDLNAEKEKLEMERAFENFEEEPTVSDGPRKNKTPEQVKTMHKSSRLTMGNKQVIDKSFDLNAEKEKLEMERAFENFEEEPTVSDGPRKIKTPEQVKTLHKSSRMTMGNKQVIDKSFDLNAEKEKLEMQRAFENFEEEPTVSDGPRKIKTPEQVKTLHKSSRMTMGNKQVIDKSFDLNAEKEKLEMQRAFENFEEEPTVADGPRQIKTPEQVKTIHKFSRMTMGNKQIIDKSFDLNAEKEKLEMERAFENFEEEPTVSDGPRKIKTPEQVKTMHKSSRMTMGNKQVIDKSFDLNAEKEKLEMERAFENFEEEPTVSDGPRKIKTPEQVKTMHKSSRMTMGNKQVIDKSFDLNAEKEKLEMERAFENFEEEPTVADGPRQIKTPEQVKTMHKSSRMTIGNKQVIDKSFDLNAEKEKLEMERAFENFEEEPTVADGPRQIKTPEQVRAMHKSSRMTMGNKQVIDNSFDLNAEKEKLEMERAFENFEEEPTVSDGPRKIKTPDQVKTVHKSSRMTMGNNQVIDKSFDLIAEKDKLEIDCAFKNLDVPCERVRPADSEGVDEKEVLSDTDVITLEEETVNMASISDDEAGNRVCDSKDKLIHEERNMKKIVKTKETHQKQENSCENNLSSPTLIKTATHREQTYSKAGDLFKTNDDKNTEKTTISAELYLKKVHNQKHLKESKDLEPSAGVTTAETASRQPRRRGRKMIIDEAEKAPVAVRSTGRGRAVAKRDDSSETHDEENTKTSSKPIEPHPVIVDQQQLAESNDLDPTVASPKAVEHPHQDVFNQKQIEVRKDVNPSVAVTTSEATLNQPRRRGRKMTIDEPEKTSVAVRATRRGQAVAQRDDSSETHDEQNTETSSKSIEPHPVVVDQQQLEESNDLVVETSETAVNHPRRRGRKMTIDEPEKTPVVVRAKRRGRAAAKTDNSSEIHDEENTVASSKAVEPSHQDVVDEKQIEESKDLDHSVAVTTSEVALNQPRRRGRKLMIDEPEKTPVAVRSTRRGRHVAKRDDSSETHDEENPKTSSKPIEPHLVVVDQEQLEERTQRGPKLIIDETENTPVTVQAKRRGRPVVKRDDSSETQDEENTKTSSKPIETHPVIVDQQQLAESNDLDPSVAVTMSEAVLNQPRRRGRKITIDEPIKNPVAVRATRRGRPAAKTETPHVQENTVTSSKPVEPSNQDIQIQLGESNVDPSIGVTSSETAVNYPRRRGRKITIDEAEKTPVVSRATRKGRAAAKRDDSSETHDEENAKTSMETEKSDPEQKKLQERKDLNISVQDATAETASIQPKRRGHKTAIDEPEKTPVILQATRRGRPPAKKGEASGTHDEEVLETSMKLEISKSDQSSTSEVSLRPKRRGRQIRVDEFEHENPMVVVQTTHKGRTAIKKKPKESNVSNLSIQVVGDSKPEKSPPVTGRAKRRGILPATKTADVLEINAAENLKEVEEPTPKKPRESNVSNLSVLDELDETVSPLPRKIESKITTNQQESVKTSSIRRGHPTAKTIKNPGILVDPPPVVDTTKQQDSNLSAHLSTAENSSHLNQSARKGGGRRAVKKVLESQDDVQIKKLKMPTEHDSGHIGLIANTTETSTPIPKRRGRKAIIDELEKTPLLAISRTPKRQPAAKQDVSKTRDGSTETVETTDSTENNIDVPHTRRGRPTRRKNDFSEILDEQSFGTNFVEQQVTEKTELTKHSNKKRKSLNNLVPEESTTLPPKDNDGHSAVIRKTRRGRPATKKGDLNESQVEKVEAPGKSKDEHDDCQEINLNAETSTPIPGKRGRKPKVIDVPEQDGTPVVKAATRRGRHAPEKVELTTHDKDNAGETTAQNGSSIEENKTTQPIARKRGRKVTIDDRKEIANDSIPISNKRTRKLQ